jgi:outer membrane protein assembly factor BamB
LTLSGFAAFLRQDQEQVMFGRLTERTVRSCLFAVVCAAAFGRNAIGQSSERPSPADALLAAGRISGGLCVQIGCEDLTIPIDLARTGRFLVQVLDTDPARVDRARTEIHSQGLYGLISVDRMGDGRKLPYTEDLVNVLVIQTKGEPEGESPAEMRRVLRPGGLLLVLKGKPTEASLKDAGFQDVRPGAGAAKWFAATKPWPKEIDQWTHPRHGADGNTVSGDTLVGPPRRVHWVTGPSRESSRLVTSAGRNFYADVLARDSFNGLPLWERPLKSSGPAIPVAVGDVLFAVAEKKVLALDGATGKTVREYPEAGTPRDLVATDGVLLAIDARSVRAVEVQGGRLCWKHEASDPRSVIAGDGAVYLLQGSARRGEKTAVVSLDLASGSVRWQKDDYPWAPQIRRIVYHKGLLVHEVSTLRDEKVGNAIHVVSAADGKVLWSRDFVPGMNHAKQARAMFVGDLLWVLEYHKCVALDPKTGEVKRHCPAGLCHCFPPVATERYMLSGEMELTDLATGRLDANRITKAACNPDYGWVPANGLIYACPKHCVCWPMLRGYVAMAPACPGAGSAGKAEPSDFALEKGVGPPAIGAADATHEWPCYRQNASRSASTTLPLPAHLQPLWRIKLGGWPEGTIAADWRDDDFVPGPVTPPVIAAGTVYVARPDAHQVVALDAQSGSVRWRYTANGRIDTPPTIPQGLCLFGTRSGWVYALRAADGQLVWRLRAAPNDERIVAYGQIESPWPVPGSVLVIDGVAYFAAGRHPLADGGILVFAVEPASGKIRWVKRLDTLPMTDFYASIGLEFDNFDLLQQEGSGVAMSRWVFDRATGQMTCKANEAFLLAKTGGSGVIVPRGCWSYAPRHQPRHGRETPRRGLVVFRDNVVLGCLDDGRTLYRREFDLGSGERLDRGWMTGWAAGDNASKGVGEFWLSQRLARKAKWSVPVYAASERKQRVVAMVLAGETLFAAGQEGGLVALSPKDGTALARMPLAAPVWDGMAAAEGRLFVSTQAGEIVCLGAE